MFGEFWGGAVLVKKKAKKIGICRIFGALTWTVEQDEALFRLCLLCWLVGRFAASEFGVRVVALRRRVAFASCCCIFRGIRVPRDDTYTFRLSTPTKSEPLLRCGEMKHHPTEGAGEYG